MARNRSPNALFSDRIRQAMEVLGIGENISKLALRTKISRQKLTALLGGVDVPLRLSEIQKIDDFLHELGLGLIARPSLIKSLAERSGVTFVLPGYIDAEHHRIQSSPFDVLAMSHIRLALEREGSRCSMEVEYVAVDEPLVRESVVKPHAALVVVGSPRASLACSQALNLMFFDDSEPRIDPDSIHRSRPPFGFYWPDWSEFRRESPFVLSKHDVGMQPQQKNVLTTPLIFRIRSPKELTKYVYRNVADGSLSWKSYGVLAAQWRQQSLWIILAGLTGPDTEAMGKLLGSLSGFALPPSSADAKSDVVWYAIESEVSVPVHTSTTGKDQRKLVNQQLISGPHLWRV